MHKTILIGLTVVIITMILMLYALSNDPIKRDPKKIKIDSVMYDKMLNIILNYSKQSNDPHEKLILIYLSTFHLFDMNYSYESIKHLDDSLANYIFISGSYTYPRGNMHHNLQKVIITRIAQHIESSERKLDNTDIDREMLDIYLYNLFNDLDVL
jgi:hypothetical protein